MGIAFPCGKLALRMVQCRLIIVWIQLKQERPGLDILVVLDLGIDVLNGAADASADRVQVAIDLRVIGQFELPRVQPPRRSNDCRNGPEGAENPSPKSPSSGGNWRGYLRRRSAILAFRYERN